MYSLAVWAAAAPLMLGAADVKERIEVPFRIADSAMIVDSVVNGRKVSCMFDTGFSGSYVLDPSLNIGPPTGTMTLKDFVGTFQANTVKVRSLSFGGKSIDFSEMSVVQSPTAGMSESYGQHVDGIMGLEVIAPYVVEINFQQQKFIFHPRAQMDITKRTPDNKRSFLARLLPKGNNSMELSVTASNGEKMTLALDTGNAFYATTHKDVLERIGLWKPGRKPDFMMSAQVASGPVDSFYVQMRDVNIYGVQVPESVWSIIDLPSSSADHDGTVGFGFLRNFNIIMDLQRRRVWLENWTGQVSEPAQGHGGFFAGWDPDRKRMRIFRIVPGGPAEKAGLQRGDDLLAVDGKEMLNMGWDRMLKLIEGPVGSKMVVSASRNGQLMRLELTREMMVNKL